MRWREAHRWLRGYSDAKAGKAREEDLGDAAYWRGYAAAKES